MTNQHSELLSNPAILNALLESGDTGLLILSPDLNVIWLNRWLEFRLPADTAYTAKRLPVSLRLMFPAITDDTIRVIEHTQITRQPRLLADSLHHPILPLAGQGRSRWMPQSAQIFPLSDSANIAVLVRDISQHTSVEEALTRRSVERRRALAKLRQLDANAKVIVGSADVQNTSLASQAALAIDNAEMFTSIERANTELLPAYDDTLSGWARALELRGEEAPGHTQRVANLAVQLARAVGIPEPELIHVYRGAVLHDIGTMGIPDPILRKPGRLDEEEWRIMRQHPVYAYEMLKPIAYLRRALDIPHYHHERWDGSGYPTGQYGAQIPLAARVFAVVDVWDALGTHRTYRPAWDKARILNHITGESGRLFDPGVVEKFVTLSHVA